MNKFKRYDDYYTNGKIELGRIGNFVSVKNHYTAEDISCRNKMIALWAVRKYRECIIKYLYALLL